MSYDNGWIRSLKSWYLQADNSEQRSVYKNCLREYTQNKTAPERPMHLDIVPLATGVDANGKWWGDRKQRQQ